MKKVYIITLLAIICNALFAQTEGLCLGDATVELKETGDGDGTFLYTVKIPQTSSFASSITPDFWAFHVNSGPSTSSTSSYKVINGKLTHYDSVTYTWLLAPKTAGICQVPSYTLKNDSTKEYYNVPSATISANRAGSKTSTHSSHAARLTSDEASRITDIIIRWKTPTDHLTVGETISCQLELLSAQSPTTIYGVSHFMPDDAYTNVIDTIDQQTLSDTIFNGKKYHYGTIKDINVTPLKAGRLTLPELSARISVYTYKTNDIIEAYLFGEGRIDTTLTVRVPAQELTVMPRMLHPTPLKIQNDGMAVCCDVSGSMLFRDNGTTRASIARELISRLMSDNALQTSYMAFASKKEHDWSNDITHYLDTITQPVSDGTALHDAFAYPLATLRRCKDVIVITDGLDNSSHISANTMLDILRTYNVRPHLIYVNSMADSLDYDLYISPDTLEDGTITPGHNEIIKIENETLTPRQIKEWKSMLRPLGGDIYTIKSKDDITAILAQLKKNIRKESKAGNQNTIKTQAHYILNRLSEDF